MTKEPETTIKLNTTLNVGHLLMSSISLLIVIVGLWVNVNVKLAQLEFEISSEKEKREGLESSQEKLMLQVTEHTNDVTRLLYEIKLELKDKEDKLYKTKNP
ncbi:MAG: hypothetical protein Tsb0034_09640 [Ekhidna sp.]